MINLFGDTVDPDAPPVVEEEEKDHKHDMFDWLHSIKTSKIDLRIATITTTRGKGKNKETITIRPDPDLKSFNPYSILNALSQDNDLLEVANMLNCRSHLGKHQQYEFLLRSIPAHKSFPTWIKKKTDKRIPDIMTIFNCSEAKAKEVFFIFTDPEINQFIKEHKGKSNDQSKRKRKTK